MWKNIWNVDSGVWRLCAEHKYNRFKVGLEDVNDNARQQPSTSKTEENVQVLKKLILNNRRINVREVVSGMKCVPGMIVKKFLHFEEKQRLKSCWTSSTTRFSQKG